MEFDGRCKLLSAFLAMEPPQLIVHLAREAGKGCLSEDVQEFFLRDCIHNTVCEIYPPSQQYIAKVLKQIILAAESESVEVISNLYERYAAILSTISKLLHLACELVSVRVYLDQSSTFLKQLGCGSGLSTICLARLNCRKVIATDGNPTSLLNLEHNLNINKIPFSKVSNVISDGQSQCVPMVIDVASGKLNNVITFPPSGAFVVNSTIDIVSAQRVNFRFTAATLTWAGWNIPFPPYGQGWFESVYMDDEIRLAKDIRGDYLIVDRAPYTWEGVK